MGRVVRMLEWILDRPELVSAAATLGLVFFAGVQISLEARRRWDIRRAAAIHARGPAWLARRTLEGIAGYTGGVSSDPRGWAWAVRKSGLIEPLEGYMLETLRITSVAGGRYSIAAERALGAFLALADRLDKIGTYEASDRDTFGVEILTEDDKAYLRTQAADAAKHLDLAVQYLTKLAPRQGYEPATPESSKRTIGGTARRRGSRAI